MTEQTGFLVLVGGVLAVVLALGFAIGLIAYLLLR